MKAFIVDSFADVPFKGNPAGVCLVETDPGADFMLKIAQELNFSETAFLWPIAKGAHHIRFYSPKMEIPLCGHATLASARVVFHVHGEQRPEFINKNGLSLKTRVEKDTIEMDFPAYGTQSATAPPSLLAALGISSVNNAAYNAETGILLLEISDTTTLAGLEPDFPALISSHDAINGVLVTAPADGKDFDFHSRYFWPWSGSNEDPVTGGTHTFLTGYWASRLGKTRMKSFQSSKRTGSMEVSLADKLVTIRAQAVIVFDGNMK